MVSEYQLNLWVFLPYDLEREKERERRKKKEREKRTSNRKKNVTFRCTQIKMYSWDNAQVVLVGNKCDLEQDRAVTQERGQRLADQLGNISSLSLSLCFLP